MTFFKQKRNVFGGKQSAAWNICFTLVFSVGYKPKKVKIVDVTLSQICLKMDDHFVENLFPAEFFSCFFYWNLPLLYWPGLFSQKILYFWLKNDNYYFLKLKFWHILRHSWREYSRDLADEKSWIEILVGKSIT